MKFNINLISVLRTKCTNFTTHVIIINILLTIHDISIVSSETVTSKPIRNLATTYVNSEPIFRVIINRDNNDIIVGARNAIYKFSSTDLQKTDQYITGPVKDNMDCLPHPEECETKRTQMVNNDNRVLLLVENKEFPILLACGDARQGMCYLLNADNFTWAKPYGETNDTLSFVGSKSSSVAFLAPYSSSRKNAVYIAHSYDGRPVQFSPPSISSRKLNGYKGFALTHDSGASFSKVDIHRNYKQTYNVKYLYGFNHSIYSYFLSTQPINVRDSHEYETKLIRICQNDSQFFSYMEIPLICTDEDKNNGKKGSGKSYYIASTAYLAKIGPNKYKDNNITVESEADTLFVAFGVQTTNNSFNKTIGSAVCAFTMKKITNTFTQAVTECVRGGNDVHILESIVANERPRECQIQDKITVTDEFCGTGHNPYIGSNRPLNGLFLNAIKGHVTSLAVAIQGNKPTAVAVIGTEDGRIMKLLVEEPNAAEEPLFEMNLPGQSSDRSIRPDPAFDNEEKYLYLLSGNELIKFPFGSCSLHNSCASCLDSRDPLGCGWCGSYCATQEECDYPTLMSKSWCPPEMRDFTPKSGPLSGGTIVTISGENLGKPHESVDNSRINITIAGSECELIEQSSTEVKCKTKPVSKEVSGIIEVQVYDFSGGVKRPFDINGTTKSSEEFKFLDPELRGVNPSFGPIAGGTHVTIVGKNLHVGSKRTILLAGIECKEINNNSTFLSCLSGRFESNDFNDSSLQTNPPEDTSVKVFIDNKELIVNQNKTIYLESDDVVKDENSDFIDIEWSEFFEYKPNPLIISIEPKSTIKSGNTNITITGKYLNSVQKPRMKVIPVSSIGRERPETQCEVNPLGTEMICKTPPIQGSNSHQQSKVPVEAQIELIMDGVHSNTSSQRLIYYPDPIYYAFNENNNVRTVYLEEPILKIDGKNLGTDYPIFITVSGRVPCDLEKIHTFETIKCKIRFDKNIFKEDNKLHFVDIKVGKLLFSPGKIKFASKPPELSLGVILLAVMLPLLLLVAVGTAVTYYLKGKGIILKKPPLHSIHYSAGDSENGHRPPYGSQHSQNNNYVSGGVSAPLLPANGAVGGHRFHVSDETMALLRAEHIMVERNHIVLEDVIGQGQFGCVYKGILCSPEKELEREVAVKTLHSSAMREEMDIDDFLQEGLMMKDFRHHHVLTLIGVCFEDDGSPMVVLPFMQNGDLLSYIRNETNMPTVKNLLSFAIEIAKGMDYLSGQKFVHRDLAARNCMLDTDLVVKVADFGLSRDIYERDYYSSDNRKCKLPVKWMSPESLEKGTYNTKTDVWSYGVLVWELLTRGVTPYPDVDNWEILNYLKSGRRMPRPSYCPELLYFVLLKCWSEEPKLRPNFAELVDEVQDVITKLEKGTKKQKVGLNVTYVNYPLPNTYANDPKSTADDTDQQKPSVYETTC